LEESETEVNQDSITKLLTVLKDVEVPLFKVVHDFQDGSPLPLRDINYLLKSLLVFLKLILVDFTLFSMQLLQKVIQVSLEPQSCVIGLLSRHIEPSFGLHVLLALSVLIESELIQLIGLDDLGSELSLLLD